MFLARAEVHAGVGSEIGAAGDHTGIQRIVDWVENAASAGVGTPIDHHAAGADVRFVIQNRIAKAVEDERLFQVVVWIGAEIHRRSNGHTLRVIVPREKNIFGVIPHIRYVGLIYVEEWPKPPMERLEGAHSDAVTRTPIQGVQAVVA